MQKILALKTEKPILPPPKVVLQVQQPLVVTGPPASKRSQRMLDLQRTIGNRAVQRLILARKPFGPMDDAKPTAVVPDKAADANTGAKPAAQVETVPTMWFLDSWGVAGDRAGAGRRDSKPDDVLILNNLKIGSAETHKTFAQAGNALSAGRAPLGPFDHSKGPGDASGVVTYSSQRDIQIDFTANTPADAVPLDKAARAQKQANEKALKSAAEKMVLDFIRNEDSGDSADWGEIEKRAEAAAAAQLPEGSQPKVTINSKSKHEPKRLETTQYQVDKPASVTVKINVPTATTTYQVHGGESTTTVVGGGVGGSTSESESIDVGADIKTFVESTKTSFVQTVNSMHSKIISKKGGGDVESDDGPELSWTEKAKKWLKGKASGLWETAKNKLIEKGIGFLKSKLVSWIVKGLELDSFIEIKLAEWAVGWLGDKAGDKIKGWLVKTHRSPDMPQHCGGMHKIPGPSAPSQPQMRKGDCPDCHDRHDPHNGTPQPPGPAPTQPVPDYDPCPPESQPPLIKSDDTEIDTIFTDSTQEIVSTAFHADMGMKKDTTAAGYAEGQVTHHTEHYYSGPVTKERIGHPMIEVIVENRG